MRFKNIQFEDGTRLYIEPQQNKVTLSFDFASMLTDTMGRMTLSHEELTVLSHLLTDALKETNPLDYTEEELLEAKRKTTPDADSYEEEREFSFENISETILFRHSRSSKGLYTDIRVTDSFCRANGYPSIKGLLYESGANAEQIRTLANVPQWVRFFADGTIGRSPYNLISK